jgi:hypothetical protein
MLFDAFWYATAEPAFDTLTTSCAECYRLSVETALAPQHRVFRLQRSPGEAALFTAHFFMFGVNREEAAAKTHEMILDDPLWNGFHALLAAARFWDLPTEGGRRGLDGAIYTLEAWKEVRRHKVVRWSPNPIFSGGELMAVITDYLERLGQLAILECDSEVRSRYVPEYVPVRQHYLHGNMPGATMRWNGDPRRVQVFEQELNRRLRKPGESQEPSEPE